MAEYRVGRHWGVTIVREGEQGHGDCFETCTGHPAAQLVAVVVNGDTALAERICALLNGEAGPCAHGRSGGKGCGPCSFDRVVPRAWGQHPAHPTCIDVSSISQPRGTDWVCGPDCPRQAPGAPAHGTGR